MGVGWGGGCVCFIRGQRHSHSQELFNKYILKDPYLQRGHMGSPSFQVRGLRPGDSGLRAGTSALFATVLPLPHVAVARVRSAISMAATVTAEPWPGLYQAALSLSPGTFFGWKPDPRLRNPFDHALRTNHEDRDGGGRNTDEGAIFE